MPETDESVSAFYILGAIVSFGFFVASVCYGAAWVYYSWVIYKRDSPAVRERSALLFGRFVLYGLVAVLCACVAGALR